MGSEAGANPAPDGARQLTFLEKAVWQAEMRWNWAIAASTLGEKE